MPSSFGFIKSMQGKSNVKTNCYPREFVLNIKLIFITGTSHSTDSGWQRCRGQGPYGFWQDWSFCDPDHPKIVECQKDGTRAVHPGACSSSNTRVVKTNSGRVCQGKENIGPRQKHLHSPTLPTFEDKTLAVSISIENHGRHRTLPSSSPT